MAPISINSGLFHFASAIRIISFTFILPPRPLPLPRISKFLVRSFMAKNVLVTGGAGYIGSHTVLQLLLGGFKTVVVDNLDNASQTAIDRVKELAGEFGHNLSFHKVCFLLLFFWGGCLWNLNLWVLFYFYFFGLGYNFVLLIFNGMKEFCSWANFFF